MELSLIEIKSFYLHEEIRLKLLNHMVRLLEKDKILEDPIIMDKYSLTVLDSTQKTKALKEVIL